MNREKEVLAVFNDSSLSKPEKIRLLEDMILDMNNELAAQDQNMHPDVQTRIGEGLQLAHNFLRELSEN